MNDGFARLSAWLDKYKIVWYLLFAAFIAFGFDFQTPKRRFDGMDSKIAAIEERIERDRIALADVSLKLSILLRIECRRNKSDAEFAGVSCP